MRYGLVISGVLVLGLAAVGCGGDDGEPVDASTPVTSTVPISPSPSAAPKVDCTKVFPQAAAEKLAGQKLGTPKQDPVSTLPACRWESTRTGSWVLVLAVPASQWARAVPEVAESALASGEEFEGRENLEEARRLIQEGGTLDDADACGIFSTILSALQGLPPGTTKVINYVPDKAAAQGINEQACLDGRYYSVQLVSPTLKAGPAVEKRIRQALSTLSR